MTSYWPARKVEVPAWQDSKKQGNKLRTVPVLNSRMTIRCGMIQQEWMDQGLLRCHRKKIILLSKWTFQWLVYVGCSFWVMCNLLWVFNMQLRSHFWRGWYQQGILGSHASIIKLSVIKSCDQYYSPPTPRSYLWMAEFDKGAGQVDSCRSHDTSTKEPSEECGKDCLSTSTQKKKKPNNFDAPYHNEYRLCPFPSPALICALMPRRVNGHRSQGAGGHR